MYSLILTDQDYADICFVGHRYGWSDVLSRITCPGENHISEVNMWDFSKAVEDDGPLFPLLDPRSDLYEKLVILWQSIV